METRPYLLHALSPLHVGTGQSVGIIDLPIARMRATGLPFVPGPSLKGVLREARRPELDPAEHAALFGPIRTGFGAEADTALDHAGALTVGDARLLALPVRSFKGTFAFVTSPLLLELARRDLAGLPGVPAGPVARPAPASALVPPECVNVHSGRERKVYLEDLDLPAQNAPWVADWARLVAGTLPEAERELVARRFVVVDDETMDFLWQTATQVDTRVRIDATHGTVAPGALWTEESLPPETLLLGLLSASPSLRKGTALDGRQVLERALGADGEVLQLGGKATVGRGRCRLLPWPREARS